MRAAVAVACRQHGAARRLRLAGSAACGDDVDDGLCAGRADGHEALVDVRVAADHHVHVVLLQDGQHVIEPPAADDAVHGEERLVAGDHGPGGVRGERSLVQPVHHLLALPAFGLRVEDGHVDGAGVEAVVEVLLGRVTKQREHHRVGPAASPHGVEPGPVGDWVGGGVEGRLPLVRRGGGVRHVARMDDEGRRLGRDALGHGARLGERAVGAAVDGELDPGFGRLHNARHQAQDRDHDHVALHVVRSPVVRVHGTKSWLTPGWTTGRIRREAWSPER